MVLRRTVALLVPLTLLACGGSRCGGDGASSSAGSSSAPASPAEPSRVVVPASSAPCFSVVASLATTRSKAVLREHGLGGNGPTWAAIVQAVVLRHGKDVRALEAPPPGYPGFGAPYAIALPGGSSWYTVDDEADAAVFCAPDADLRAKVKADVERADQDDDARARAIAEAAAFADDFGGEADEE